MSNDIQDLHHNWSSSQQISTSETYLPTISFDQITSAIFGMGSFFYYVIDFYDMSLSTVSNSIADIHDLFPEKTTFDDVLNLMHPDDLAFVNKAEAACINFMFNNIQQDKLLQYKASYNFRAKLKNGEYGMINHQALILTMDESGRIGKALNIHTKIDHLSNINPGTFSLIGLNGNPSYLNLSVDNHHPEVFSFSNREINIIKLISDGYENQEIADLLFISVLTVKKHRSNILKKSNCKNTAQLVKKCLLQGII